MLFTLFEQKNAFCKATAFRIQGEIKDCLLLLQMMLRSLIPPLRGRIISKCAPRTPGPLRPFPLSSMRVPLDIRRPFSVGNNLPIQNHLGGRGPFAAANSLQKPFPLQRPTPLASIFRLLSPIYCPSPMPLSFVDLYLCSQALFLKFK